MVNNKIAQRAVAAGLSGLMAFGAAAPAALATGIDVKGFDWYNKNSNDDGDYFKRLGGDTRYDTMKKIVEAYNDYEYASLKPTILDGYSKREVWNYHSTAVLASGDNFPDALAANGLAGYLTNEQLTVSSGSNGAVPVILTKQGSLSSQAKDLLKNMQVQNVIIMGGTAAVSQDVEDAIAKMGIGVQRVAGKDRQETSLKALQRINGNWKGRKGTYDLIIATGDNYADALSISPYAYRMGTPVILTQKDGTLTDDQVAAIKANDKIAEIVIVGGTSAVSDAVMGQIGTVRNNSFGIHYTRIAGADRYETSAKIAEFEVATWRDYYNNLWSTSKKFNTYRDYPGSLWQFLGYGTAFSFDHVVVATGENFPDALAGGQLAGGVAFYELGLAGNVDGFDYGAWSPCPLLLTKDGNTQAEAEIVKNLSQKQITVDDDYYFTFDAWKKYVKANYAAGSSEYKALLKNWFLYATDWAGYTFEDAFTVFPFYVSIDGLVNSLPEKDTSIKRKTDITYTVYQQGEKVIFELVGKDNSLVESVKFDENAGITLTLTDEGLEYLGGDNKEVTITADELKGQIGDKWNKVTDEKFTATYTGRKKDKVTAGTIDDKYVVRFVARDQNFYGIILGGTAAVSNNKRDKLDDAVAASASVNNLYNLTDSIDLVDKDWGVNIHYTRLKYVDYDGTDYIFRVAATGDMVTYNDVDGWKYTPIA